MSEHPRQSEGVPELPSNVPPIDVVPSLTPATRARSEGPRFIDSLDDDADLTDLDRSPSSRAETESSESDSVEFLLKPLCGRQDKVALFAVSVLCAAIVLGALTSHAWFFVVVLTVLYAGMHTAVARLALSLGSRMLAMRVGEERDAWTTSGVLAAFAMLGASVPTPLPGGSGGMLIGAALYVAALRRFTDRGVRECFVVSMFHFFIALGAFAILSMYAAARSATSGG